eukprot:TRINITY_DN9547_c0_g1_i5.p1 TRINITY_DN9547_c0_g1~~TRINITY_DN9547_c0_g1_i5.p1  ORF type:complete len:194 (-),score=26.94 TRINITY_DN9547_c0_g1_i5:46-627(-)
MCNDESENCIQPSSNQLLWGEYARFQFVSVPAIKFSVYRAFIYLPNSDSQTGVGEELNIDDIVTTNSRYGLLKIKYQVSSQASTVGTSVNLKFLIKQKANSTRRALDGDDDGEEGIAVIDMPNIKVLNENETLSFLAEDEEFEIVWWFYLMIVFFLLLIGGNILIFMMYQKNLRKNFGEQIMRPLIQIENNQA